MALSKYEDLTDIHLDVLKEVGNIGSGNAAAALSTLINKNVQIQMPEIVFIENIWLIYTGNTYACTHANTFT